MLYTTAAKTRRRSVVFQDFHFLFLTFFFFLLSFLIVLSSFFGEVVPPGLSVYCYGGSDIDLSDPFSFDSNAFYGLYPCNRYDVLCMLAEVVVRHLSYVHRSFFVLFAASR